MEAILTILFLVAIIAITDLFATKKITLRLFNILFVVVSVGFTFLLEGINPAFWQHFMAMIYISAIGYLCGANLQKIRSEARRLIHK